MIGIVALGLIQAAAAAQPAGELRRSETTIAVPTAQFQFPDEIASMMFEYLNCLQPRDGLRAEGMGSFEAVFRARMQACRPTRDWAIASAVRVFKPDPDVREDAHEQLARIFDKVDAAELQGSRLIDEQFRAQMGLPATDSAKVDDAKSR